jgi:hypothetical protein
MRYPRARAVSHSQICEAVCVVRSVHGRLLSGLATLQKGFKLFLFYKVVVSETKTAVVES